MPDVLREDLDHAGAVRRDEWRGELSDLGGICCDLRRHGGDAIRGEPSALGSRNERTGHLVHKQGGRCAFRYHVHGDPSRDAPGFHFETHAFVPGEYVSLPESDDALCTFASPRSANATEARPRERRASLDRRCGICEREGKVSTQQTAPGLPRRTGDYLAVRGPRASPRGFAGGVFALPEAPIANAAARKSFPISWDQFHRDARALAWRLADKGPFEAVVCIVRGGLVPAAIVARELGLRVVEN